MARITLNNRNVAALLKSPQVQAELRRRAERVRAAADAAANDPGGHRVVTEVGHHRARAAVITDTPKSMWKEAVHHTLTSSLDAGRG